MTQPVATKAFLQSDKTATMCTACHDNALPSSLSPLFASAKLIFKVIVATDNMQPDLHDEYTPHH